MDNVPQDAEEYRRWWIEQKPSIPYGLCWCGCGGPTTKSRQTTPSKLLFRTQPRRYIFGHQMRSAPTPYTEEDRGYKTPCWVWHWCTTRKGYGQLRVEGKTREAHRYYYEREYGPIPEGMELDHLCAPFGGPRNCIRYDHLQPVEHAENLHRGKGTILSHEKAEQIRTMWNSGKYTQGEIAGKFGVKRDTAHRVISGRTWI